MLINIVGIIGITLMYSTPLIFGALGGVISERAGVVNIGIEGMMVMGAFTGATVGYFSGNPWLGFLAAGLAGSVVALLLAIAAVNFKADQTIVGMAINLIGPGLALFLCKVTFNGATMSKTVTNKLPKIWDGSSLSNDSIFSKLNIDSTAFIALILTSIIWFIFYKTKWGLRIRSVGEHPAAADTLGVNVSLTRYVCVLLSGMLAGFGGASMTLAVVSQFAPTVISGQGFIALAAVIFGKWTPFGAYGACMLFSFAQALIITFNDYLVLPSEILSMFPYVLTIIVLILFVGRSVAPKADGVPYEKGKR